MLKQVLTLLYYSKTAELLCYNKCNHNYNTKKKHDLFNVITYYVKSGTRIAEQASICVYKADNFFFFMTDRFTR